MNHIAKVVTILVNWNGWKDTIRCLESLKKSDYPNNTVVIVDNGSSDDSRGQLTAWINDGNELTVLISAEQNGGFARGCNIGIKYAFSNMAVDYIWLLNNDTEVTVEALTRLVDKISSDNQYGVCGSSLLFLDRPKLIQTLGGKYCPWTGISGNLFRNRPFALETIDERAVEEQIDYVVGASMLIRKKVLDEIGLLAEDYFIYFEELDFIARMHGNYRLGYAKCSVVFHKEGASIKSRAKTDFENYYFSRNRAIYTARYHKIAMYSITVRAIITVTNRLLHADWGTAAVIFRAHFAGMLYGLRTGVGR